MGNSFPLIADREINQTFESLHSSFNVVAFWLHIRILIKENSTIRENKTKDFFYYFTFIYLFLFYEGANTRNQKIYPRYYLTRAQASATLTKQVFISAPQKYVAVI